jgi:hypothetical protein
MDFVFILSQRTIDKEYTEERKSKIRSKTRTKIYLVATHLTCQYERKSCRVLLRPSDMRASFRFGIDTTHRSFESRWNMLLLRVAIFAEKP